MGDTCWAPDWGGLKTVGAGVKVSSIFLVAGEFYSVKWAFLRVKEKSRILVNFDWNTKEVAPLFWSWNITTNYVVSYFFLAYEVVEKKRQFAYEILLFSVELKVIFISNTPQNTLSSSVNMYDGLWQDTWPIIA